MALQSSRIHPKPSRDIYRQTMTLSFRRVARTHFTSSAIKSGGRETGGVPERSCSAPFDQHIARQHRPRPRLGQPASSMAKYPNTVSSTPDTAYPTGKPIQGTFDWISTAASRHGPLWLRAPATPPIRMAGFILKTW